MELAVKAKAKRRHLSAEDCGRLGRSSKGTDALTQPNNVTHRSHNYDPNKGLYPRTPTKKLKHESPIKQQKGITEFFSVTKVVSSSPQKYAQQLTSSQSQGLDIQVTPKKETKYEEEDDTDDDDVSLLAMPLKQEQERFSVTTAVSFSPRNSAQHCTSSQSQGLGREVTPKKEPKVEEEEDDDTDDDDVSLLAMPLKQEQERFSVTSAVSVSPRNSARHCTTSQSQGLAREVTPKKEPKVDEEEDDDDISLLVTAIKKEEEIDYLEGITAEMWDNDQFDDDDALPWSQENGSQVEREEELTQIDVEALPDAYYGLLGSSRHLVEPQGCADDLPVEVLRKVLSLLPAQDLYRHAMLVCHRWKEVIEDPKFVPLKKRYYQFLMGERNALSTVRAILEDSGVLLELNDRQRIQELHLQLPHSQSVCQLVSLMAQHMPGERVRSEDLQQCVGKHRLFPQAEACIASRFPTIPQNGANRAYAAMALILLLSEAVKDVQALVSHLQGTMTRIAITEFLSEMATFLLAMDRNNIWISNRLHYNIYYVLHLMENAPTPIYTNHSGPQVPMTHEQHQILSHDIKNDHVVKIMAFAGTGKTTTLVRYAEQRPHLKFLYVAFNKSVAVEAQRCFPRNVTCKTIHSMAYHVVGYKYKNKLSFGGPKALSMSYVLPKGSGGFINGKIVADTLNAYMASADRCINTSHVPPTRKNNRGVLEELDNGTMQGYVNHAQKIWDKMINPNERSQEAYKMSHDGYLKLWQLQNPSISDHDVIFIDEAQDCTPAILDILLPQPCGKILVGDPHQQIYTFRGAVNALHMVEHTHLFYLTQSFRFGAEIAYVGATILRVCKKIKKKILVGGKQPGRFCDASTYPFDAMNGSGGMSGLGKTAILSRTNVSVFDEAVKLTDANACCRIHFVGGSMDGSLKKILDIYNLKCNTAAIGDSFIRLFRNAKMGGFAGLKKYAEQTEDRELEAKVAVVEKYNTRIPVLVEQLNSCFEIDMSKADFILGTVHKSKGLEFDSVIITDDFAKVPCERHNLEQFRGISWSKFPVDEWNLLYVAVTRAKTNLIVSSSVGDILTQAGEYSLKSEMVSSVMQEDQPPKCAVGECENFIMSDSAFAMCKRPMRYTDIVEVGGPLCERCVWQRIGPTAFLLTEKIFQQRETEENVVLPNCYVRIW